MKFIWILAAFVLSVTATEDEETGPLQVPRPVMEFIMGCKKRSLSDEDEKLVPVYRTDISAQSGTTSQHVSLLDPDELEASLKSAIVSDKMTEHIMDRVLQKLVPTEGSSPSYRQECPATNVINIDVPPEELEVFHIRMERVMQQNNNILLGLINDMISTKFTTVQQRLTKLINERMDKLDSKIEAILSRLLVQEGVAGTPSTADVRDEDSSADSVATESPKIQPNISKQDDPEVTNAFAEIVQAIKSANEDEANKTASMDETSKEEDVGVEEDVAQSTSPPPAAEGSTDTTPEGPSRSSMHRDDSKFISNLSQLLQNPGQFVRLK